MTTRTLAPDIADRLAKLLGMLGSAHPGERAAAALKVDELLKREGLSWSDVIRTASGADDVDDDDDDDGVDWRAMAVACAARASLLTDREASFVRTLVHYPTYPSQRQIAWLVSIFDRIGVVR